MKTIQLITLLILSSLPSLAQDTTKVLFIGNSITYFNGMPQTFEAIANSQGDPTEVTMYAPGGTGFIHHVNDANVYNHFQTGIWDYIVLQPGSNESPGYSEPIEATLERARILKDSALFYNPCAKILFYEISYGVWGSTAANLDTYNTTMDLIRGNLEYLADSTELFFAPAGEAMRTAWNDDTSTLLWGGTGDIHPNAKGSYIIACSFYASIFQKPSFGTTEISSLTPQEASAYQELADTTVLNYLSDWRINTYHQFTDFDYALTGLTVDFQNASQNIDSLTWNFGDGTVSQTVSPSHTYATSGTYTVVLTTFKDGCMETKTVSLPVAVTSVEEIPLTENVSIYPNPFAEVLFVESNAISTIELCDVLGRSFISEIDVLKTNIGFELHTEKLPKGTYLLITDRGSHLLQKN